MLNYQRVVLTNQECYFYVGSCESVQLPTKKNMSRLLLLLVAPSLVTLGFASGPFPADFPAGKMPKNIHKNRKSKTIVSYIPHKKFEDFRSELN